MLDILGEANTVALIGLLGGIALGLAARVGRFCTLGAIEDVLYSSDDRRIRMWGLAIGTSIIGVHFALSLNHFDSSQIVYLDRVWNPIASVLGGLMFGYGMALSGNCGYGALARLGGGDIRSFVILIVMGFSAYFVMSGPLANLRIWAFPVEYNATVPQGFSLLAKANFGLNPEISGGLVGGAIIALSLNDQAMRQSASHIVWGLIVGLVIVSGWLGTYWVTATGFEAQPIKTHSFTAPIGDTIFYGMTASSTEISFSVGSVLGVVIGAVIGSFSKGHFRWEACDDPHELGRQILGAAIMGAGAILAVGCSIGQGIAAFSVLAFSAPITFIAIFIGAAFGLKQLITGFNHSR